MPGIANNSGTATIFVRSKIPPKHIWQIRNTKYIAISIDPKIKSIWQALSENFNIIILEAMINPKLNQNTGDTTKSIIISIIKIVQYFSCIGIKINP